MSPLFGLQSWQNFNAYISSCNNCSYFKLGPRTLLIILFNEFANLVTFSSLLVTNLSVEGGTKKRNLNLSKVLARILDLGRVSK